MMRNVRGYGGNLKRTYCKDYQELDERGSALVDKLSWLSYPEVQSFVGVDTISYRHDINLIALVNFTPLQSHT